MEKVKYNCNYYNTGTGSWKLVYKQPVGSAIDLSEVGAAPQPNAIEISLTIKEECKCNAENYVDDDTGVMVAGNNITWAYRNSECDCTYDDGQGSQFPSTQICPSKFLSNNASDSFSFASLGYSDSAGRLLFDLSNNDKVQQKTRDNAISELVRTAFTSVMRDLYCDCLPTDDSVDEIQDETGRDVANPADPPIIVPDGENAPAGSYTGDWMIRTQILSFSYWRVPRAEAIYSKIKLGPAEINYNITETELFLYDIEPQVIVYKELGTTYDTLTASRSQKFSLMASEQDGNDNDSYGSVAPGTLGPQGEIYTNQSAYFRRVWDPRVDTEFISEKVGQNQLRLTDDMGPQRCGCIVDNSNRRSLVAPFYAAFGSARFYPLSTAVPWCKEGSIAVEGNASKPYQTNYPNHLPIGLLPGPYATTQDSAADFIELMEEISQRITNLKIINTELINQAWPFPSDILNDPEILIGISEYDKSWHDYT